MYKNNGGENYAKGLYDYISIDWEFPAATGDNEVSQTGFSKWDRNDGKNLASFCNELKEAAKVHTPGIKLQVAISADP